MLIRQRSVTKIIFYLAQITNHWFRVKREIALIYHQAACVFFALMMASGVAAQALPDSEKTGAMHQFESDLTGYWQTDGGQIFYFVQEGSSLISRHSKPSAKNHENEIDFTATIHGNLIYGAHRAPVSRAVRAKCSNQIWVGMGLTLNDERTALSGFRGDRIVDQKNCRVKNSDPVVVTYTRIANSDRLK